MVTPRPSARQTDSSVPAAVQYRGEQDLKTVMELVDNELSEPYSIFTYRCGGRNLNLKACCVVQPPVQSEVSSCQPLLQVLPPPLAGAGIVGL